MRPDDRPTNYEKRRELPPVGCVGWLSEDLKMEQLSKEQAIAMHDRKEWENWSHEQRAKFQMQQDRLCMPFDVFQEAVEKTLGRPVWTHEFGLNKDGLMQELFLGKDAPSMTEIFDMLPADKTVVVGA